ncbi:hypothetical protein PDE_02112 [Penicillium oxalicum 114-2]|uniref:Uncharacterized protein n=1 Tax=Penicillium oxalicum (strain 114-2 / CGMCC 5302) TaxID=933388 RepID=S7ZAC5_PENO1|nr:hypothetical protein PDE_02112 [Penicillium oxalicum 114-2]
MTKSIMAIWLNLKPPSNE